MSLVHDLGAVIGQELRAYYNGKIHNSLDTWSPTININRDPRWVSDDCGPSVAAHCLTSSLLFRALPLLCWRYI